MDILKKIIGIVCLTALITIANAQTGEIHNAVVAGAKVSQAAGANFINTFNNK